MEIIKEVADWVAETFYTHSRTNAFYVCGIQIAVCTALLPIFRPLAYAYWQRCKESAIRQQRVVYVPAVQPGTIAAVEEKREDVASKDDAGVDSESRTDAELTETTTLEDDDNDIDEEEEELEQISRGRWWFNTLYTVWTGTAIFFLVPYTMLRGSVSWLCYWAYAGQVLFFALTLLCDQCGYKGLKKWVYQVILPMIHSTMLVANGLYTYYGLWQWLASYIFSHCVPPLVVYAYIAVNGDFLTEDVLPLDTWFGTWLWFALGSVELVFYRLSYTPAWIYDLKRMEYMYEVATIGPVIGNGLLLAFMCASRYYWLKRQCKYVVSDSLPVTAEEKKNQ